MQGFSPMNKYGLQTVIKLASCYGLKSSAQGSGKKQFVVVRPLNCLVMIFVGLVSVLHLSYLCSAEIRTFDRIQ